MSNQTNTVSRILANSSLNFRICITENSLKLPDGIQSFCVGIRKQKWLLIGGRSNGLHGFSNTDQNFPVNKQNVIIYVVDIKKNCIYRRSLIDPKSELKKNQIDYLSVTNAQFCQDDDLLYITGGYGINSQTQLFETAPILSIIDIKGLINWVRHPESNLIAVRNITQLNDPIFQITGGSMSLFKDIFLLVFGQTFNGIYSFNDPPTFTQIYSNQVRKFQLCQKKGKYEIQKSSYHPIHKDPNYRRRDLNVLSRIRNDKKHLIESLVAYSGVFTVGEGIWTVPVEISNEGETQMADPNNKQTFKQGLNNYACASVPMYSIDRKEMYTIFFGGMTFQYFNNGVLQSDYEIPFTNECTTIKIDSHGKYSQYLMDNKYPVIFSTSVNSGNQLLFGSGAQLIIDSKIKTIENNGRVIDYDQLSHGNVKIGYIVGGIQSTIPNTSSNSDTSASNRIFDVSINIL